jgi:hypothetical protein
MLKIEEKILIEKWLIEVKISLFINFCHLIYHNSLNTDFLEKNICEDDDFLLDYKRYICLNEGIYFRDLFMYSKKAI